MLSIALPSLPPPATSLLPVLHEHRNPDTTNNSDGQNTLQSQQQSQQRRVRGPAQSMHARSVLAVLANEERILDQRRQAIQTYGYSWLKPAGCTKTMLGRREEEIEREEAERQLREVEMQERNAVEVEEAERMAQQEQQRAREDRGQVITGEGGDRDLDEDLPDMDGQDEFDDEDDEDEEENDEEEEEEGDLDDDIPEGDSGFAYDTTRDPDTESDESVGPHSQLPNLPPSQRQGFPSSLSAEDYERTEQEAIAHQMLDEDELGDYGEDRDLDGDVPDMDDEARDLDDEVPDADEDDEGGWEHTDTELDESDMDISLMPPGGTAHHALMLPPSSNLGQRQRQAHGRQSAGSQQSNVDSGLRRTSGNVPLPMAPPSSSMPQHANRRGLGQSRQAPPNFTPAQIDSDISVSALISTGNTGLSSVGVDQSGASQRAWLDPASARRNLFGANRLPHTQSFDSSRGTAALPQISRTLGAIPNLTRSQSGPSRPTDGVVRQVSSGGLFTPPTQQQDVQRGGRVIEEPRSRTRSGRPHGATRGGYRAG